MGTIQQICGRALERIAFSFGEVSEICLELLHRNQLHCHMFEGWGRRCRGILEATLQLHKELELNGGDIRFHVLKNFFGDGDYTPVIFSVN
jgi:hypothetical protein